MTQLVARPAAMDSLLVKMPLEVIHRVAYFLPTSDLCLLRCTCKAVESATFIAFCREFFAKKQFMLTELSLQTLLDISQHPTLGPSLTHLIIGLDRYPSYRSRVGQMRNIDAELSYREAMDAQQELLNNGRAATLLAQALRNLRGLQTIDIRDFNSPSRWRDGGAQWSSYGATVGGHYNHDLVMGPTFASTDDIYVDRAFKIVLVALAESGINLPNLEVVLKDRGWGLTSRAFPVRSWLAPTLEPVLANLQRLHLAVVLSSEDSLSYPTGSYTSQNPDMFDPFNASLRRFLTLTPNLLWLRVNFQNSTPPYAAKFLSWLGKSPHSAYSTAPPHDPDPVSLPLQQLDLGVLRVSPAALLAAIVKFSATLKAINLWDVALVSTTRDWDEKINLWAKLFKSIAASGLGLNLQSIMVGRLRQVGPDGYTTAPVKFGTRANGTPVGTTKYTSSTKDFLLKLAGATQTDFPSTPDYESDEEANFSPDDPDEEEDDDEEGSDGSE